MCSRRSQSILVVRWHTRAQAVRQDHSQIAWYPPCPFESKGPSPPRRATKLVAIFHPLCVCVLLTLTAPPGGMRTKRNDEVT